MEKNKFNHFNFFIFTFSYLIANDLIRGIYTFILKNDLWIYELVGLLMSLFIFSIYYLIYKKGKVDSFCEAITNLLGPFISKVIFILYMLYFIIISFLNIRDITAIIQIYFLEHVPIFVSGGILLLSVYYIIRKGIEVMSRTFTVFLIILVIAFLFTLIFSLISNKMHLDNILPILEQGSFSLISSFKMAYAIPFGELFVLIVFFQYFNGQQIKIKNAYYGIILASFVLIIITLFNITLVGVHAMQFGLNPTVRVVQIINVKNYFQRLDILFINIFVLFVFTKVSVLLFASQLLFSNVIKLRKNHYSLIFICLLIFVLLIFIGRNYFSLIEFRKQYIIPYLNLMFEIVIPCLLLIFSFIIPQRKKSPVM